MLQVGDKVVMNRNRNFSNKKETTGYSWWKDMEDLGVLTIYSVKSEDIDTNGNYPITFVETNYCALNTWVERVN